jgi:glucokinase-like ROK family protein
LKLVLMEHVTDYWVAARRHLLPPQARAVESLRKHGPLTRTDLADVTGYSRSTMTSVVNELEEIGIVVETGDGESTGGRRPRVVNFRRDYGYVIGVDMGATSLEVALADFSGAILERVLVPIDVREGPDITLAQVQRLALDQIRQHEVRPEQVLALGIGVPGPVEFASGVLNAPPIMPGWNRHPIRPFFREAFPNALVIVDNDVNVMALGELTAGAGISHDNWFFVKVGTGIGCGIVCGGQIYRGANGSAGDIGHICADKNGPTCHCGNVGCLEAIAAGPPIAARAAEAARAGRSRILAKYLEQGGGRLTAIEVGLAAEEGDKIANEIVRESGRAIGEVLASLVNFYNPSLILIGGGVSNIGLMFLSSIRSGIFSRSLPLATRNLRIDASPMREDAGVVGATALALTHVFADVRG